MKQIGVLLLLFLPTTVMARLQGKARADSLVKALTLAKNDTNKIQLLDDIAYAYKTISPETGIIYARQELALSTALDWKKGIAMGNAKLGLNYQFQYNYAKALEYDLKALKVYEELGDKQGMATVQTSLANVYSQTNNFEKGLEYDMHALSIFKETNDKRAIAITEGNIGNIYQVLNNYPKALEYDTSALISFKELDDKSGIARNLGNIGNVYLLLGNYSRALDENFKALEIFKELGERQGMGLISGNIGEIYLTIAKDTVRKIGHGQYVPANRNISLANAIVFLKEGAAICTEIKLQGGVIEFSKNLAEAYALSGNYKEALASSRQYSAVKDSTFSQQNMQKIALIDGNRDREMKDKELEMQQMQLQAGRNEKRYYIAGIAMLLLFSVSVYRRFRGARKTRMQLEEKNILIAEEKEKADILRERAERSEKFKQQFLTNMSHEIRTPMNAVSGMTDLLLEKNPRPDQLHHLQIISRSSDILLHIINDILDLSKIESGKLEIENIDFSLQATVRQVKETLSFRAEEKGLHLVTTIDDDIPDVLQGDPFRLNQVLINLGGNAVKFTERGSVEISALLLKKDEHGIRVQFSVTDTGVGIRADKISSLFKSFSQVQTAESRKYVGTGLGLSISKQLVELQGGIIEVESEPDRGSVFSFEITYPKGSEQRLQERTNREQKADGSMLDGLRILLTDDNEYNRMVASETLMSKANVLIEEAADGQEAIDMLELNDYDVILMDIQMPVMNGLDATRYIRQRLPEPKRNIPIIALTASLLRSDVDLCNDAGMNTYVPKPFKAWQLIAALAEVTGRKNIPPKTAQNDRSQEPVSIPVTDLAYLENFCEGDKERMQKVISIYIASVPAFVEKINAAIAASDKATIASQVHAFKPRWWMMGMKQSTELSLQIEKQIREQTDTGFNEKVFELLNNAENSVKELNAFVAQNN